MATLQRLLSSVLLLTLTLNSNVFATAIARPTSVVDLEGARRGCQGTFLNLNRAGDTLITTVDCLNNFANGGVAIVKNGRRILSQEVAVHPYLTANNINDPTRVKGLLNVALVKFPGETGSGMSPIANSFVTSIGATYSSLFRPLISMGLQNPTPVPPESIERATATTFRPGTPVYNGEGSLVGVSQGCEVGPDGRTYGCTAVSLHDQATRQLIEQGRNQFGEVMAPVTAPDTSHELGIFRIFCRPHCQPAYCPPPVYYYTPPAPVVYYQPVPVYFAAYQPPPPQQYVQHRVVQQQQVQQHQNSTQGIHNSGNSSNHNSNTVSPNITINNNPNITVRPNITVSPNITVTPQNNNGTGNSNSIDHSRQINELRIRMEDMQRRLQEEQRRRDEERRRYEQLQALDANISNAEGQIRGANSAAQQSQNEQIRANEATIAEQERRLELQREADRLRDQNRELERERNEDQSRIRNEQGRIEVANAQIAEERRLIALQADESLRRQLVIVARAQEQLRFDIAQAQRELEMQRLTRIAILLQQPLPNQAQLAARSSEFGSGSTFSLAPPHQAYLGAYARSTTDLPSVNGLSSAVASTTQPVTSPSLASNQTPIAIAANSSPYLPNTVIAASREGAVGRDQMAALARDARTETTQVASSSTAPRATPVSLPLLTVLTR